MPGVTNWVTNPLNVVQTIYESSEISQCHQKCVEYFKKQLQDQSKLSTIPSLNDCLVHELPPNSLVHFRCMVQDMYDPEFYLGAYEVKNCHSNQRTLHCGLYKDVAYCRDEEDVDQDSPRNVTLDRVTYYCISVPGENQWVQQGYAKSLIKQGFPSTSSATSQLKRPSEDIADSESYESNGAGLACSSAAQSHEGSGARKKTRVGHSDSRRQTGQSASSQQEVLNFPLPEMQGVAALIKLYDDNPGLKVNDLIEVIGILSIDPTLANPGQKTCSRDKNSDMEDMDEELVAHNPPPSLVPRVHAILVNVVEHNNPYLPPHLKEDQNQKVFSDVMSQAAKIRAELHAVLTQVLLGDSLAAEYLICHLISSIYVRRDVVVLGKFCLNLMNVVPHGTYVKNLYNIIQQLTTQSYFLPLTLNTLNTVNLNPKKNYTTNRLESGMLQLTEHTHLVLDETVMNVGQLNNKGIQNLSTLGNLINWQYVEYDFTFHKMEYTTDIATLVISEGKSLLPSDCHVPLRPMMSMDNSERQFQAVQNYLTGNLLQQFQCYISVLKLAHYTLSEELKQAVQEDFVDMRRHSIDVAADDLHSLLVLARGLSLSVGETTLTKHTWEKAKFLEAERKHRMQGSI